MCAEQHRFLNRQSPFAVLDGYIDGVDDTRPNIGEGVAIGDSTGGLSLLASHSFFAPSNNERLAIRSLVTSWCWSDR